MSVAPDPEHLLAGLDAAQRQVATALTGPVVVRAGAGTGKTRAITHRIAYAVATGRHDPEATLAVTFTNRAAGEMSRRLGELGVRDVRVRTFHSAALRQLRWAWPEAIGGQMHEVFASKFSLVKSALAHRKLSVDAAVVRDITTEIEWAKMAGADAQKYPALADQAGRALPPDVDYAAVADVYEAYEHAKRVANRMDFEDVLLLTVAVLEEREDLRRQVQAHLRHFTVDEFQDISDIQRRLLDAWLGDRDDVCVVGDPAQTIYSFAGADAGHLARFAAEFASPTIINLHQCYRCSPQIVDVSEQLLAGSPERSLTTARVPLQSQGPDGRRPAFTEYPDELAEASAVVRRIAEMIRNGRQPSEIAILVRINAMSQTFEAKLAEAGIAYTVRSGRQFFDRPEVKQGISLLRAAARTDQLVGMSDLTVAQVVRRILESVGYTPTPPETAGAVRDSWESASALVSLCDQLVAENPSVTLSDIVADLAERETVDDAPSPNGVTIASLHAAKGMEWDAVFLVGLIDGIVPMNYAKTPAQIEEERRLLYVGMTRARSELALSWAVTRAGVGRPRKPSRFLTGLRQAGRNAAQQGEHLKERGAPKAPAACRRCGKALVTPAERSVRRCRTCPSDVDEALLADLREWRASEVAVASADRERPIPAYIVATDAMLFALAEERPTTAAELADIPGMGERKLADHGDALLAIVARREKRH